MKGFNEKVIITMPELMEQMDVSDKTIHRMIEEGELPDFSYGSRASKKKGWHSAVLERHAMEKYEKSQSIKDAGNIRQIGTEDVGISLFRGRNGSVTKNLTNFKNRNATQKQLSSKKMSQGMRSLTF